MGRDIALVQLCTGGGLKVKHPALLGRERRAARRKSEGEMKTPRAITARGVEAVDKVGSPENQEQVAALPRREATDFRAFPPGG